jgi:hypothetical protein
MRGKISSEIYVRKIKFLGKGLDEKCHGSLALIQRLLDLIYCLINDAIELYLISCKGIFCEN